MNMSYPLLPSLSLFHTLPYTHVPVPVLEIYYILTSYKIAETYRRASVLYIYILILVLTHSAYKGYEPQQHGSGWKHLSPTPCTTG